LPWQPKVPSSRPAAVQFFFLPGLKTEKPARFHHYRKSLEIHSDISRRLSRTQLRSDCT
jgi:hypothetical protein